MANFMALVYATLKKEGIDTSEMTNQEAVQKFNELNSNENLKKEEIEKHKPKPIKPSGVNNKASDNGYKEYNTDDYQVGYSYTLKELKATSDSFVNSLHQAEKHRLKSYTQKGFTEVNNYLRNGGSDPYRYNSGVANEFSNKIKEFNLPDDVKVFRGVGDIKKMFGTDNIEELVGSVFTDKGFTSTSFSREVADRFYKKGGAMIEIDVPKGKGRGALYATYIKLWV